jgi:hypothetical protein
MGHPIDLASGDIPSSTLANSTLIILFSEMLKFSKIISSESKFFGRIIVN